MISQVVASDDNRKSTIHLANVPISARGEVECKAMNEYGSHSRETLLRVKSKFAPIWPAIGIVVIFVVLLFVIFTCEKTKKK